MSSLEDMQKEIDQIKKRNNRVELEKKREMSLLRKVSVALITYILLGAYMYFIWIETRYLDALVPTLGFVIGTWSVNGIKKTWLKQQQ